MKRLIYFIMILLFACQALAYPIIASNQGTDHQKFKEFVGDIPLRYLEHVKWIELLSYETDDCPEDAIVCMQTVDHTGFADITLNPKGGCYDVYIYVYNYDSLYHELGHVYDFCELKTIYNITSYNYYNETAENFAEEKGWEIKRESEGLVQ